MRYKKQVLFEKIGSKGQKKISSSTIGIVGLGATGSNSANLLLRSGVKKLVIIDRDVLELDNLQRQTLYEEKDVNKPKALCAKDHLSKINSQVEIKAIVDDVNFSNISDFLKGCDIVLDCTDNFETRFLLNDYCNKEKIPFVYSGVIGDRGAVMFIYGSPCLRCVFLEPEGLLETCDTFGVLNSAVSMVSALQVNLAIRHIIGEKIKSELMYVDLWDNKIEKLSVSKRKDCICCQSRNFEYLKGKKSSNVIKLCGQGVYHISGKPFDLDALFRRLSRIGNTKKSDGVIVFEGDILFSDGRAIIKAKDQKSAKAKYNKYFS